MSRRIIAVLIDTSGSMAGYKIVSVEESLRSLLDKLGACQSSVRFFRFAASAEEFTPSSGPVALSVVPESGTCQNLLKLLAGSFTENDEVSFVVYGDGIGYFAPSTRPPVNFGCWRSKACICFRVGDRPSSRDGLDALAELLSASPEFHSTDDDMTPVAYALKAFVAGGEFASGDGYFA